MELGWSWDGARLVLGWSYSGASLEAAGDRPPAALTPVARTGLSLQFHLSRAGREVTEI